MTEAILELLKRLNEIGDDAILSGELVSPYHGPVFDRLLAKRIIVEQAPLRYWDVCDDCECGLISRPIRPTGDEFRVECPLDSRRDIVLAEDDLRVFRIEAPALAREIGAAVGLDKEPFPIVEKIWRLGATALGRTVFLALERTALTGESIVAVLRQVARSGAVTVLTPKLPADTSMRFLDAGFHLVETASLLAPNSSGDVRIDAAVLEPIPDGPSLLVRMAAAEVRWSGRSVVLSHQLFPVFQRLLDKAFARDPVASGSYVEDTTGREAKDLIREVREAFKAAGFSDGDAKALIQNVRGRGYRIGVPASEISIET